MTPGPILGSKLTPGTLLRDYFQEPLVRLSCFMVHTSAPPVALIWLHLQKWSYFRLKRSETAPPCLMELFWLHGWSRFGLQKVRNGVTGGTKMVPLGKGELESGIVFQNSSRVEPFWLHFFFSVEQIGVFNFSSCFQLNSLFWQRRVRFINEIEFVINAAPAKQ